MINHLSTPYAAASKRSWMKVVFAVALFLLDWATPARGEWVKDAGASFGYMVDSGTGVGFDADITFNYTITTNSISFSGDASAWSQATVGTWIGTSNITKEAVAHGYVIGKWNWNGTNTSTPVTVNVSLNVSGYVDASGAGGNTYPASGRYTTSFGRALVTTWSDTETTSNYFYAYGTAEAFGEHNSADSEEYVYASFSGAGETTTSNPSIDYSGDGNSYTWEAGGDYEIIFQTSYQTSAGVPSIEAFLSLTARADTEALAGTPSSIYAHANAVADAEAGGSASISLSF